MDETFTLLRTHIDATYVKVSAQNMSYSSQRSQQGGFPAHLVTYRGPLFIPGKNTSGDVTIPPTPACSVSVFVSGGR